MDTVEFETGIFKMALNNEYENFIATHNYDSFQETAADNWNK